MLCFTRCSTFSIPWSTLEAGGAYTPGTSKKQRESFRSTPKRKLRLDACWLVQPALDSLKLPDLANFCTHLFQAGNENLSSHRSESDIAEQITKLRMDHRDGKWELQPSHSRSYLRPILTALSEYMLGGRI